MATPRRIPINRNNKFFSNEDFNLEIEMVVYKTTNLVNGKIYIGQDSKNNPDYLGSGVIIKRAIKKYGKENFIKEVIDICKNKEILDEKEKFWIKKCNSRDDLIGYNITEGGEGCLGLTHSEESKNKMSKAHKGNKYCLGYKHTDITKEKMSINNSGINNPMYGVKLPIETLVKRSNKVIKNGTFKGKNNGNFKFDIDEETLIYLFLTENKTIKEIATYFGCSRDVINNNLRAAKINKPKSNKYNLDIDDILSYINDGLTQVEISVIYGCSNKHINKYIKKHG